MHPPQLQKERRFSLEEEVGTTIADLVYQAGMM